MTAADSDRLMGIVRTLRHVYSQGGGLKSYDGSAAIGAGILEDLDWLEAVAMEMKGHGGGHIVESIRLPCGCEFTETGNDFAFKSCGKPDPECKLDISLYDPDDGPLAYLKGFLRGEC